MNTERIRRLAEQAGDDWDHTLESDKEFLEKFAELIVRKCADLFEVEWGSSMLQGTIAAHYLKQHFGVEE